MPLPLHMQHLINASLEVERARLAVDDEARNFTTDGARNYTVDGLSIDALMKAGRRGVAILATDDGGFDVVPIGDTEATVREIPPGSPKPWEDAYTQISGEGWERAKAENRAARPPGANPPIHQEGQRPTSDALMMRRKEEARMDAIERNKRKTMEEREYMKKYAADMKAYGEKTDTQSPTQQSPTQQSPSQGPMTAAKLQALNEEYRKTA